MDYIYVLLVVAGSTLQSCLTKMYQSRTVNSSMTVSAVSEKSFFLGMSLSASAWVILLVCKNFSPEVTVFSAVNALLMSVGGTLTTLFGIMILSRGKISVYTLFLMLGGMILPFLAGAVFWEEQLSVLRITGLLLLVISLVLPLFEKNGGNNTKDIKIFALLCIGLFLANGSNSVVAKYHQTAPAHVDTISFMILRETINTPLNAALFLFLRIKNRKTNDYSAAPENKARHIAVNWVIIITFAAVYCASHFFNLIAASVLDASLQFPVITGGTLVLTALAGLLFFREKLGKFSLISIAAAFAATVLFGVSA